MRIEFIDITDRMDTQAVFFSAATIAQAGGAIVAGTCRDFGESIAHDNQWEVMSRSRI